MWIAQKRNRWPTLLALVLIAVASLAVVTLAGPKDEPAPYRMVVLAQTVTADLNRATRKLPNDFSDLPELTKALNQLAGLGYDADQVIAVGDRLLVMAKKR